MNAYYNGLITNEEVIKELLEAAREIAALYENGEKLGLTQEELVFQVQQSLRQQKGMQGMDRQQLLDHVKHRYNTTPDYPWADQNAVLRHGENRKWYGLIMEVGRDKLGLTGDGQVEILNVKCDPMLIGSLRGQEGFHPAYHMNKEQWISIRLDGSVPAETVKSLLDLSYGATKGASKGKGAAKGASKGKGAAKGASKEKGAAKGAGKKAATEEGRKGAVKEAGKRRPEK